MGWELLVLVCDCCLTGINIEASSDILGSFVVFRCAVLEIVKTIVPHSWWPSDILDFVPVL